MEKQVFCATYDGGRVKGSDNKIIGRSKEKAILREAYASKTSEFIALYGRRRVGKTYLIKNFFDPLPCTFIYISGMKEGNLKQQLRNFADSMEMALFSGARIQTPTSWMEAFKLFTQAIADKKSSEKIVFFIDELPWLATKRSNCLQALDYYWNRHWSHNPKFKLVVCGSVASWIIKNIIQNKGGLYNRITRQFRLDPLQLWEAKDFLLEKGVKLSERQILELYITMGGIPYYLNEIKKGKTATQLIAKQAFSREGSLYQDFDILFHSLFDHADTYIEILRLIGKHRYGIEQNKLIQESKSLTRGGRSTQKLRDLEEAGFIISLVPYGQKNGVFYRIVDEYVNFYLKWIEPIKRSAKKLANAEQVWLFERNSPSWKSWFGYAFEMLCMKHISQIQKALNIPPSAIPASWRYAKKGEEGAQIDLLFDRPDGAISICEVKYTEKPFKIDKAYYLELERKIKIFQKVTRTRKDIFLEFVSASGLKETIYSEEYVSGIATLEDLFKNG